VLYGVGAKLDTAPDLFFVLRSVDPTELLSGAAKETLGTIESTDTALAGEDLNALFGIELAPDDRVEAPAAEPEERKERKEAPKGCGARKPKKAPK